MKNSSTVFGGYKFEAWQDTIYGSGSGTRLTPTTAARFTLHGVMSVGGKLRGKPTKIIKPQTYTRDVDYGAQGGFRKSKSTADGRHYNYQVSGEFGNGDGLHISNNTQAYSDAVGKLAELVRGSIDLSVDVFQARQTIELAKRILSVRKVVQYLAEKSWVDESARRRKYSKVTRNRAYAKKRDPRDRFKQRELLNEHPMKEVGSLYLEFTYGVKPTMQTIYDLVHGHAARYGNAIALRNPMAPHKGIRGSITDQFTGKTVTSDNRTIITTFNTSHRVEIGGYYIPSDKYAESLSRLTSLNPASIAWELLPFSFVVDWFVDVGGYLRTMETALISRLGTFNGYRTDTTRYITTTFEFDSGRDQAGNTISGTSNAKKRRQIKTRRVLTSFPLPSLPSFKADLGSSRLINAAALMSQFLGRK